jgi:hypothetical protein
LRYGERHRDYVVSFKILVTLALAVTACSLVFRIGRPGASLTASTRSLLPPLAALMVAIVGELNVVPDAAWKASMMGHRAAFRVFLIPLCHRCRWPDSCWHCGMVRPKVRSLRAPLPALPPAGSPPPSKLGLIEFDVGKA